MDYLPQDPAILVSSINMLLRDEEFDSLESLCYAFGREPQEIRDRLAREGFVWSEEQKQFRPKGFRRMITRESIETAYSFLHQKRNVYVHSNLSWQRDDIEYAISSYVDNMNAELLAALSDGRTDFLRDHVRFEADITLAVERLEEMLTAAAI